MYLNISLNKVLLNPLSISDDYDSRHLTLAACYQLAQSASMIKAMNLQRTSERSCGSSFRANSDQRKCHYSNKNLYNIQFSS